MPPAPAAPGLCGHGIGFPAYLYSRVLEGEIDIHRRRTGIVRFMARYAPTSLRFARGALSPGRTPRAFKPPPQYRVGTLPKARQGRSVGYDSRGRIRPRLRANAVSEHAKPSFCALFLDVNHIEKKKWTERDLNPWPHACEACDLPADLSARQDRIWRHSY